MLLLTDQQLSCGFWMALGSLLSTLFCGVSLLLMFFFSSIFVFSHCYVPGVYARAHTHAQRRAHLRSNKADRRDRCIRHLKDIQTLRGGADNVERLSTPAKQTRG